MWSSPSRKSSAAASELARLPSSVADPGEIPGLAHQQRWPPVTHPANTVRRAVSKKKRRFMLDGVDLDLSYVTPRVIAMAMPATGVKTVFRNPLPRVRDFLDARHPGAYLVADLCTERTYDPSEFAQPVLAFPFDDHQPPPLDLIPRFCREVGAWLAGDSARVVAVHCKAGKGRTGVMVSALLLATGEFQTAEEALDWFGRARSLDGRGVTIPSQRRYVHYAEALNRMGALVREVPAHAAPVALRELRVSALPSGCLRLKLRVSTHAGQALLLISPAPGQPLVFMGDSTQLSGDLRFDLIEVQTTRPLVHGLRPAKLKFWINTGFLPKAGEGGKSVLTLSRQDLDIGTKDKQPARSTLLPPDFTATLIMDALTSSNT
mmetsp:Transcript_12867/g.43584  ORF Transcript_12867/g.43584 Transcript_12867/m.43584 type:complete len:377 (+) Transcript_12867:134-1264(+)